ncbi:MAG: threonine synthase [Pseudomonadota bacterium]|nr:threonine synthase [Pseudomonadota bacterium]
MRYKSTRGNCPEVSFSEVLLGGLAPDGGLYMPTDFPFFSQEEIHSWSELKFYEIAAKVLYPYVEEEIEEIVFEKLVKEAYSSFDTEDVVALQPIEENRWVLELFHGPTLAFKDIAMQLLGALLNHFARERGEKIVVLGATSGDTGAAAISACSRYENVEVYILYPNGKVTEFQRKQMTTTQSKNVYPLAIESDFDGCQDIVKKMFLDEDFLNDKVKFIAANSINWARCMTQSVYFFWSYLKLRKLNNELIFSIPSGNFGHAYAGWTAKQMGLPIKGLIIATNTNDVLHEAFSNQFYAKTNVVETLAPSMDISVASNFERLLYNLYDDDPVKLSKNMLNFPENPITIPEDKQAMLSAFFSSSKSSDEEIVKQIALTYERGYLADPHTATGIAAASECSDKEAVITMGTAHPAKFKNAMERAIPDYEFVLPNKVEEAFANEEVFTLLSNDYLMIKEFILQNAIN